MKKRRHRAKGKNVKTLEELAGSLSGVASRKGANALLDEMERDED